MAGRRSVENLPLRIADSKENERENAAAMLELHAIYNIHGSAEDARATVDLIEPGSIVYVEGMVLEPTDGNSVRERIQGLALHKRRHGMDDWYYAEKATVAVAIQNVLRQLDTEALDEDDFAEFYLTQDLLLLEKDCEIITADYVHGATSDRTAMARTAHEGSPHRLLSDISPEKNAAGYIVRLEEILTAKRDLLDMRENEAVDIITRDIAAIIADGDALSRAPKASSGKVKAYICYGSGHKRSLTQKISDSGIAVSVREVEPINTSRYHDETKEKFKTNFLRRLSHAAFDVLSWQYYAGQDPLYYNTATDYMYWSLEEINANEEQALAFCARCLGAIRLLQEGSDETAEKEYREILLEYGRDSDTLEKDIETP